MTRPPMPSPSGRNAARLFLSAGFPAVRVPVAAAYDQAVGERPPAGWLARAAAWMVKCGCSASDVAEFIEHMDGEAEAGGRPPAVDTHATSAVHNKLEEAAHSRPHEATEFATTGQRPSQVSLDKLPHRGQNDMPRHALDEITAAARRYGRGPLGYA